MGAPRCPTRANLIRRMQAWGDEWRAIGRCTEPADRPRAEAAIRSLYASAGLAAPVFLWVRSPAAGIKAYAVGALRHAQLPTEWGRGDTDGGTERGLAVLSDFVRMEPAWVRRLVLQAWSRVPQERRAGRESMDPMDATAAALGIEGASGLEWSVRFAVRQIRLPVPLPAGPVTDHSVDTVAAVLGSGWPDLVAAVGEDSARFLFARATRAVATALTERSAGWREAHLAMQLGQFDAALPVIGSTRDVFGGFVWGIRRGRAEHELFLDTRLEIARSAGPWWALDGLAIVSERPVRVHLDDRGRLHRAHAAALTWRDGFAIHAWHGLIVPPRVILEPERISVEVIDRTANTELRRVLVERFGPDRLIREGGGKLLHEDETGRLWQRPLADANRARGWPGPLPRHDERPDEPIVMVEVRNATPEPDGTRKTYFLRVPPTMTTAREAVARTFAMTAEEYRPQAET